MTRETKLGLVVAASFLALVGGVLAVKLHQGGLTTPDPDEVARTGEGDRKIEPPVPAAPTNSGEAGPPPAPLAPVTLLPSALPSAGDAQPPVVAPPPAPLGETQPSAPTFPPSSTVPPANIQPPALNPDPPGTPSPSFPSAVPNPLAPAPITPAPGTNAPPPAFEQPPLQPPAFPGTNSGPGAPAVSDPPAPSPAPGAAPLGSGPTSPTQDPFKQPDPPVQTPTKQPEPDKMPDVKSNTILLDKQPGTSDVTPPAPPATAPPPQNNGPASTEPASPPPVMQPPAFTPVPTTPVAHAPGSPAVTPAPAAAPAPLNPNFTSGAMPTAALIPEPAAGPGNAPATLGPPGGRPATASPTAPISRDLFTAPRSAPPPEPKAQSYLEEQYRWQPNDTFAGVSQRFYFSDKYAPALAKYNQEYPLASPALRQNPPAPGPGQTVWIPPVRILERDYGQLISGLQPLGPNGVPATPASRPSGPTVVAVAPPPTAGPVGQYTKVRGGGENLYEIARRTLNDNGQWYLIYRLNPALSADPKLPIPAGTVLRLPPEARVADGDRP